MLAIHKTIYVVKNCNVQVLAIAMGSHICNNIKSICMQNKIMQVSFCMTIAS